MKQAIVASLLGLMVCGNMSVFAAESTSTVPAGTKTTVSTTTTTSHHKKHHMNTGHVNAAAEQPVKWHWKKKGHKEAIEHPVAWQHPHHHHHHPMYRHHHHH